MSTSTLFRPSMRRLLQSSKSTQSPPSFLLPALHPTSIQQSAPFSTTPSNAYPRDMNRERGVSTARRTGPRQPLSVSKTPLPQPMTDATKKSKVEVDPNHGLWAFFHSKDKPMNTPEEDAEHGRAWRAEELRQKSWEDLHAIWWKACRERNVIKTESYERERLGAGYGGSESEGREVTIRRTQRAIKQVLTERYYSWRDAEVLARDDPEIHLEDGGPLFVPTEAYEEGEVFEEPTGEDQLMLEEGKSVEGVVGEGKSEQRNTTL